MDQSSSSTSTFSPVSAPLLTISSSELRTCVAGSSCLLMGWFVIGLLPLPCLNQSSMAHRSYTLPSIAVTGSTSGTGYVLAREAADPLMTVHGDADANPYARPARGGGGCAVM